MITTVSLTMTVHLVMVYFNDVMMLKMIVLMVIGT